jgi:hypothetical protein
MGRAAVGTFCGGMISSDAGALLLGAANRAINLVGRFAACFSDARDAARIEDSVETFVGQCVFGIALGCQDHNDHDEQRHDSVGRFGGQASGAAQPPQCQETGRVPMYHGLLDEAWPRCQGRGLGQGDDRGFRAALRLRSRSPFLQICSGSISRPK